MSSRNKAFIVEKHDKQGVLINRFATMIEDNPAYGEVECQKVLAIDPRTESVSILQPAFNETGDPIYMISEGGSLLRGSDGNPRQVMIERMRFGRSLDGTQLVKILEHWPH